MATPNVKVSKCVQKPGDESTKEAAGVKVTYDVHIRLSGTTANVQTDWATLIATNFACAQANITWNKTG